MDPYSREVLDHFQHPRNAGEMNFPDAIGRASLGGRAPYVTIYLRIRHSKVEQAVFQCFGCGYTIAACSALTELITGEALSECRKVTAQKLLEVLGGMPSYKEFCAEMPIDALHDALNRFESSQEPGQ